MAAPKSQPALAARVAEQTRHHPRGAGFGGGGFHHLSSVDVEMVERDRDGAIHDRLDLMHGVALPPEDESWLWPVAPFGEAEREREFVHRVCAWRDLGSAKGG